MWSAFFGKKPRWLRFFSFLLEELDLVLIDLCCFLIAEITCAVDFIL